MSCPPAVNAKTLVSHGITALTGALRGSGYHITPDRNDETTGVHQLVDVSE